MNEWKLSELNSVKNLTEADLEEIPLYSLVLLIGLKFLISLKNIRKQKAFDFLSRMLF